MRPRTDRRSQGEAKTQAQPSAYSGCLQRRGYQVNP